MRRLLSSTFAALIVGLAALILVALYHRWVLARAAACPCSNNSNGNIEGNDNDNDNNNNTDNSNNDSK